MTEGLRLPLLAVAIALAPITAGAQVACIPPEELAVTHKSCGELIHPPDLTLPAQTRP